MKPHPPAPRRDGAGALRVARLAALVVVVGVPLVGAVGACRAIDNPRRPAEGCARSCARQATHCSPAACAHGCAFFAADRIAEGETANVIRCVAAESPACGDPVWAYCASRVGPHADGGPPAPAPPRDDDDDEAPAPAPANVNKDDQL